VDPAVNQIDGIYCYDIDDLSSIVENNNLQRKEEAIFAEQIIKEEISHFEHNLREHNAAPLIKHIHSQAERIIEQEVGRVLNSGVFDNQQKDQLEQLCRGIVKKLLHQPVNAIKESAARQESEIFSAAQRLFNYKKS